MTQPGPTPTRPLDLDRVPQLAAERLGGFVRGRALSGDRAAPLCTPNWGALVAASSTSDGWSAYILYRDHIVFRDPWTLVEVDLQTERIIRHEGQKCDCWFPTLMPDGCVYVFPEDTVKREARVARFDPRKGELETFGPGSPDSWNRCASWGPDDCMYVGAYRRQCAMRFDPNTGEFVNYGPQGPGADVVQEGIYHIAADDNYVYTTMGGKPYCVYSCHKQTRKQTLVLELEWPERAVLVRRTGSVYVIVDVQRDTPRLSEPTAEILRFFRLEDNTLTPVDGLPPEPDAAPQRSAGGIVKPQIVADSPRCRPDGTATLWYKPHGRQWRSVTFDVGGSQSCLFRLGTFAGGIVGSSEDPYSLFLYDPDGGAKTACGPIPLHAYAFQEHDGAVYYTGYPSAPLYKWDPQRPWTQHPPRADEPPQPPDAADANPRRVAAFEQQRRAYGLVLAADGRVYAPCSAMLEALPGGLLGWYDPSTGDTGGVRQGFECHSGVEAQLACDGRFVVVATRPWPRTRTTDPHAYVLTYDTRKREVTGRVRPIHGCAEPSRLVEWRPGKVVGRCEHVPPGSQETVSTFYLLDVEAQTCQVTLQLPEPGHGRLLRLPNGKIASLCRNAVLVIDPSDWSLQPLGEFDCQRPPSDWLLLGNDLYVILDTELARGRDFQLP